MKKKSLKKIKLLKKEINKFKIINDYIEVQTNNKFF